MEKKTGWTFPIYHNGKCTDYFIESDRKNKTRKFAEKIIEEMGEEVTEHKVRYILYHIERATLEVRYCHSCGYYYDIYGENFWGRGSSVNDGRTIILQVD